MAGNPQRLLIRGGQIYDHDGDAHKPPLADILIEGGDIVAVGRDLETAFEKGIAEVAATAPVVVRREYRTARQVMNPLEGKAVLAQWEGRTGQLVVHTSTQVPHMIRAAIAEHLGLSQGRVRVIAPDVGGG